MAIKLWDKLRQRGAVRETPSAPTTADLAPIIDWPPQSLRAEIELVCIKEGGYPTAWPRHTACPACARGPLVEAFHKYGFRHDRCESCGFVTVNPFPTSAVMDRLYSGTYYTNIREFFEKPLVEKRKDLPFSAPRDVLDDIISCATEGREAGRWLDVGGEWERSRI